MVDKQWCTVYQPGHSQVSQPNTDDVWNSTFPDLKYNILWSGTKEIETTGSPFKISEPQGGCKSEDDGHYANY